MPDSHEKEARQECESDPLGVAIVAVVISMAMIRCVTVASTTCGGRPVEGGDSFRDDNRECSSGQDARSEERDAFEFRLRERSVERRERSDEGRHEHGGAEADQVREAHSVCLRLPLCTAALLED